MRRTLEAIFRRPVQLLMLIIFLPLVSVAIAYFLPRTYQVTTSLWALRRYEVIGATGPETDPSSTPAQTQATTLTELLLTRDFALVVAKATSLASTFDANVRSDPQELDDAMFAEISKHVEVQAQGYNLFIISYTNRDPRLAKQVVAATIQTYESQSLGFATFEGENLLENYQAELVTARQEADAAAAAEAQYLAANPTLESDILHTSLQYGELEDPQYALLHTHTLQTQATVNDLETRIAGLNQDISSQKNGTNSLFKIIDPPLVPIRPLSRVKLFLEAGATGLGLALAACALYIIMALRRNSAIYTMADLERVTSYPVVMQLPSLTSASVPLLLKAATQNGRLLDEGSNQSP